MKKIGNLQTYSSGEIEQSYVGIDFCCLDRELFNPEKCYDLLARSGVKYARCQTGWARCEKVKGVYHFEWLDSVIDNLEARGIIPWFNVGFGNPIYMPDASNETAVGCVPLYYGDETLTAWKNFIRELIRHFKDRISYFEIWNEPELSCFWYPKKPNAAEYARLVNITAQVIHEIKPDAKIGVCFSSPYHFEFIDTVLENVEKGNMDFLAYHVYSTVPEFRYAQAVAHLRRRLDEKGLHHVELWQGEAGYPSWAYEGHWLLPEGCNDERPQAVFQLRRYFLDIYNGVKLSSFFQMADMWEKPYAKANEVIAKPAAQGVLNGCVYTPKKSYETLTYLAAIFSGNVKPAAEYIHVDIDSPSPTELLACETMVFEKNGDMMYAYYLPVQLGKMTDADIPYKAGLHVYRALRNPVLIDSYTGEVFALDKEKCGCSTAYENLPLKDYPLIVTEKSAFEII